MCDLWGVTVVIYILVHKICIVFELFHKNVSKLQIYGFQLEAKIAYLKMGGRDVIFYVYPIFLCFSVLKHPTTNFDGGASCRP